MSMGWWWLGFLGGWLLGFLSVCYCGLSLFNESLEPSILHVYRSVQSVEVWEAESMEDQMARLSLLESEASSIDLELDGGAVKETQHTYCLVGRLLTERAINFPALKHRLAGLWRPGRGVTITDPWPGRYLFKFHHQLDVTRILEGGPWSFDNHLLVLHQLQKDEPPSLIPLNLADFWMQVHDVPTGCMSESTSRAIGNSLGCFLMYDPKNNESIWRQYMRIRVRIDVTKPLPRCKKIKKPSGEWGMVYFRYERLPHFCFICGCLGHTDKYCPLQFDKPELTANPAWGAWLRADPKPTRILGGEKWLREEEEDDAGKGKSQKYGEDSFARFLHEIRQLGGIQGDQFGNSGLHGSAATFLTNSSSTINGLGPDGDPMEIMKNSEANGLELVEERKRKKVSPSTANSSSVTPNEMSVACMAPPDPNLLTIHVATSCTPCDDSVTGSAMANDFEISARPADQARRTP